MYRITLLVLLIACHSTEDVGRQTNALEGDQMLVQRVGSDNEYDFLIHEGRIIYHITNAITGNVLVLRGISVDGRDVIFGGGAGYSISVSTQADMSDNFWSGGEAGFFEGDFESDPMSLTILADSTLSNLLPGESVHVSHFEIRQTTVTYSKHEDEGAILAIERRMIWNGVNMRHEVTRTTLQDICIWTEYVSSITTRGSSHPTQQWPINTAWTNAGSIIKNDFGTIIGEARDYTMDNLGERLGVPSSDYMWLEDGTTIKLFADGLEITLVNDTPQKIAVFDKGGETGGLVQVYHVSYSGQPDLVDKRTTDTWGHTITVDPL